MKNIQHTAFFISRDGDKDWLMDRLIDEGGLDFSLSLNLLKGEIFSNNTLQHFILEEIRHEHVEIVPDNRNSLSLSSTGEQRKALLFYIIAKKPDYIIIDNVLESLDKNSREFILLTLRELSSSTLFLQVFNRKNELLPFIELVYTIKDRTMIASQDSNSFLAALNTSFSPFFNGNIPLPLIRYSPLVEPLVKMNNISVQYDGRQIVQNICWEIKAGEFWQLTGPNGSGKSTLLSLITGNSPKGYGQDLVIFGHRKGTGETVWDIKEKIGYFTPSMTLQFERQDSIEQMVISGFFDSVGLYIKPSDRQVQLAKEWLLLIGMYKE